MIPNNPLLPLLDHPADPIDPSRATQRLHKPVLSGFRSSRTSSSVSGCIDLLSGRMHPPVHVVESSHRVETCSIIAYRSDAS